VANNRITRLNTSPEPKYNWAKALCLSG